MEKFAYINMVHLSTQQTFYFNSNHDLHSRFDIQGEQNHKS
jgi:hypothetical protein